MKAFILAFLTLAAVAVSADEVSENPVMSKSQYVELLERKLGITKGFQKRGTVPETRCKVRECASPYHYCDIENYTCSGFSGCINNTCVYSKAGDRCGSSVGTDCYHPDLYCDNNRCREYAVPGTICRNQEDCYSLKYNLYCNVLRSDERPLGFCKVLEEKVIKKAGQGCDYTEQELGTEECEEGSYCDADEVNRKGVCKAFPRKVNEPCEMELGCYGLYCFEGNETCQPLPKAGQMCVSGEYTGRVCADGLYCDGTFCRQPKDLNETCSGNAECLPDLRCLYSEIHKDRICTYYNLTEGEYCSDNHAPQCYPSLFCINNTCTRGVYECVKDEDCPDFTYHCTDDHKCVGGLSIGEDEECFPIRDDFATSYEFHLRQTLQCKPGLVCVANVTGGEGYVCKKAHSKKGDLNYCYSNEDCPYDAVCKCDDSIGLSICAPIPSSSKELKKLYENYLTSEDEELVEAKFNFYEYLIDNYLYYSSYFRCDKYTTDYYSAASALKASVVMTAVFALFAFLF